MMMFVKDGRIPVERLVDAACLGPSRIFGLAAGSIAVGMPAHLAVFDLHEPRVIRGKRLNSRCAWSPFEGREAIFPKAVFLRGRLVVDDWEPSVTAGEGTFQPGKAREGPV